MTVFSFLPLCPSFCPLTTSAFLHSGSTSRQHVIISRPGDKYARYSSVSVSLRAAHSQQHRSAGTASPPWACHAQISAAEGRAPGCRCVHAWKSCACAVYSLGSGGSGGRVPSARRYASPRSPPCMSAPCGISAVSISQRTSPNGKMSERSHKPASRGGCGHEGEPPRSSEQRDSGGRQGSVPS